jgi:hypothetical protein
MSLFDKTSAMADISRMRAMLSRLPYFDSEVVTNDHLFNSLRAAEADVKRKLKCFLEPTEIFSIKPTPEQIAALNGQPWAVDSGYDYNPSAWLGDDNWGMMRLKHTPVLAIRNIHLVFGVMTVQIPNEWIRLDPKYGSLQFYPTGALNGVPFSAWLFNKVGGGRVVPLAFRVDYLAGLGEENGGKSSVEESWPDLIDCIRRAAMTRVIGEMFLASSESISADGISQSISADFDKYQNTIDGMLFGTPGNGGLFSAIHGIQMVGLN